MVEDKDLKDMLNRMATDASVSPNEQKMIERLKIDLSAYEKAFSDAVADGIITPEEKRILHNLRILLIQNLEDSAYADGQLTVFEKDILLKVALFMAKKQ